VVTADREPAPEIRGAEVLAACRYRVAGTSPAGSGAGLPWSVGPVDGNAAATFVTTLAKPVTSAIRKSVDRFCPARAPEAR
jgi:hypothetical protein